MNIINTGNTVPFGSHIIKIISVCLGFWSGVANLSINGTMVELSHANGINVDTELVVRMKTDNESLIILFFDTKANTTLTLTIKQQKDTIYAYHTYTIS